MVPSRIFCQKSLGVLKQLRKNPYDLIRIIPAKGSGLQKNESHHIVFKPRALQRVAAFLLQAISKISFGPISLLESKFKSSEYLSIPPV
jgi:hypothetical protein